MSDPENLDEFDVAWLAAYDRDLAEADRKQAERIANRTVLGWIRDCPGDAAFIVAVAIYGCFFASTICVGLYQLFLSDRGSFGMAAALVLLASGAASFAIIANDYPSRQHKFRANWEATRQALRAEHRLKMLRAARRQRGASSP